MAKRKTTKKALLASALALLLCVSMLIGTTFAWFTDSVTSGNNKIIAGILDVELEYSTDGTTWEKVDEDTELFDSTALWEPGHTEVVYLKVSNVGTLALKYQFAVNVISESTFTNALGEEDQKLSKFLVFGQVESNDEIAPYTSREDAWKAAGDELGLEEYTKASEKLLPGKEEYVALVVYMPTTVGNEANYRGDIRPEIELGVTLLATQTPHEKDSFDENYDKDVTKKEAVKLDPTMTTAEAVEIIENAENGTVIDGQGMTLSSNGETLRIGNGKDVTLKNLTIKTTNRNSYAIALSPGASVTLEDCKVEGKAWFSGENITVRNTSFDTNINVEGVKNVLFEGCTFTKTDAMTLAATLENVTIQNNYFAGGSQILFFTTKANIRIYDSAVLKNVQIINNTSKYGLELNVENAARAEYNDAISRGDFVFADNK